MEIFSLSTLFLLEVASLVQTNLVGGNSLSTCGGIFEDDSGEFEYHGENVNVDDLTGSSVCVWMIKLLSKDGAGVSLKLEDLDENSVVNLYAEGEPTDPVNTPNTLNSTQINSAVELSGSIFIITLKSQLDLFETSPTTFVVSWSFLEQLSTGDSKSLGSKILPVEFTSTNYLAAGVEKGRYNFKTFHQHQKSVWILEAGFDGSLDAEVNIEFDSSCLTKIKSANKSGTSPKALCECSYFGLFEIVPSTGRLRSVNEFCGRSASSTFTKLSTQLVGFIYSKNPTSGSNFGESAQISWKQNKETTNPTTTTEKTTTTTEFPSSPEPPIKVSTCPQNSTISPCTCNIEPPPRGTRIVCSGFFVNETSIENTFSQIRRVNGIPQDRGIHIYMFEVYETELTQLDLVPLYGSQIDYLIIRNNYNLTKLVTSGNPRDHGSINVHYRLDFMSSPLSRNGFGDALKYFSSKLTSFTAYGLGLNDDEFLPGFSAHTNLQELYIYSCNISERLSFDTLIPKELQKLQLINIGINSINEIGENAFDFEGREDTELYIYLGANELNETSFHPNSGIARAGRKTTLSLWFNEITTLPAPVFETFLDAHPQNSLDLLRNPLICDERLSWLKSRRDEFDSRVQDADCSNDPGQSVFDSDLIPEGNFLYKNKITSLPTPVFETFLDAHPDNSITLSSNPLICDGRLSWLKSRREELESRVRYAKCSNDPGHTVFDSDLIP